jgi:hypothetical protein
MNARQSRLRHVLPLSILVLTVSVAAAFAQAGAETFSGTASVKAAGGAAATSPVTITVTRKMSQAEVDKLLAAFKSGGAPALRKALTGVPTTGSIQMGSGKPTPTALTLERPSDRGRLLTIVSTSPIMFVGGGMANAKPKEGFDFGIVDLVVDAGGAATGTMSPAAKVTVRQGVFVVDEYSGESVQLTVKKAAK